MKKWLLQPMKPWRFSRVLTINCAIYFLLVAGVLSLAYVGMAYMEARQYQRGQYVKFESESHRISRTAPRFLAEGDMLGELQVPRLQLNAIVVQGDSNATLKKAVGHLADSPMPGEWGNVALAGHRDTFFRPLRNIRVGDEIRLKTLERNFEYRVESIQVVAPTDVAVLKSSTGHNLTLLTCYPIYYVGPAPNRLIVRAREVEAPLEGPARNRANPSADAARISF